MARRILIISSQNLFGEAIRVLLEKEGFQVLDSVVPDEEALSCASRLRLDALVLVDEGDATVEIPFTARLLQRETDLPVIRVGLEGDRIFVHETHQVPARSADLVAVIRGLPDREKSEAPGNLTEARQETR